MPNFWSETTQKVYEVMYGPRTRDTEFDQKVDELNIVITAIKHTNAIIKSFSSRTAGIQKLCQEVYSNFATCYTSTVIYAPFIKDVCDAHKGIEASYLNCVNIINSINNGSAEWDKLFAEVNENLKRREQARSVYDHYDAKMETLVRARNDKLSRRQTENVKDIEKFDRNDGKYKRAANDLIQLSNYTYQKIQELLDFRYRLLNPVISIFISEEKKFFDACSNYFRKFEALTQKITGWDRGYQKTPIQYDPCKHIRATRLLVGINASDLPQVKQKDKYTYDDYKNKKGNQDSSYDLKPNPMGPTSTLQPNRTNSYGGAMNPGPSGGYPYEVAGGNNNAYNDYRSSTLDSKVADPFSYDAYKQKTKSINKSTNYNNSTIANNGMPNPSSSYINTNNNMNASIYNNNINNNNQVSQSYMPPSNTHVSGLNFDNNKNNNYDPLASGAINPYASIQFDSKMNNRSNSNYNPYDEGFPK